MAADFSPWGASAMQGTGSWSQAPQQGGPPTPSQSPGSVDNSTAQPAKQPDAPAPTPYAPPPNVQAPVGPYGGPADQGPAPGAGVANLGPMQGFVPTRDQMRNMWREQAMRRFMSMFGPSGQGPTGLSGPTQAPPPSWGDQQKYIQQMFTNAGQTLPGRAAMAPPPPMGLPAQNPMASQMNALLSQQIPGGVQTPLYAGSTQAGVPASNPMASQMNALLAQQLMPTGLGGGAYGLPAVNPMANQMNALLGQQLMPYGG